jgi:hypothetical protein
MEWITVSIDAPFWIVPSALFASEGRSRRISKMLVRAVYEKRRGGSVPGK